MPACYMESLARVLFLRDYVLPTGLPLCFKASFCVNRVGFFHSDMYCQRDLGLFDMIFGVFGFFFFCCSFCRSIFDFWQVFIDGAAFTKIRGFTLTFPKYLDLLHQLTISIFIQYFYFSFLRMPSDLLWRHFWGRIFSLWLCKYLLSHSSCVLSIDPAWSTYHYR